MAAFPKKTNDAPKKIQTKLLLSEEAKEQLTLLSRKLVLSQSEVVELLIRKTYTAQIELTNVQYLESREEILRKIITDLHTMRGEVDELKGR